MKVVDPVCGMQIEDNKAAGSAAYKGITYFFCSESCKNKFIENPESFVDTGSLVNALRLRRVKL